jgi:hypothetical protein
LLSNKKAKTYNPVGVNQRNFQYGGSNGERFGWIAENDAAARRSAGRDIVDLGQSNEAMGRAYGALDQSWQARAQQGQLAAQLQQAANGQGPSLAAMQLQQGQQQAAQNALNVAATSRGGAGAGAALAAQDANMRGAQAVNQQAAQARMQEQIQARGELAGVLGQMRGGDLSAMQGGLSAMQAAQGSQGLMLQQNAQNDAAQQYFLNQNAHIRDQQFAGQMGLSQAELQAALQAQSLTAGSREAQQQRNNALWGGLLSGGAGALSMGMMGGGK